ncbi:MAG: PAS domain S-box protein [Bdellovibrionaceae bacterium]|nr:PAS domain S-box protein [Pseudobdellovibrionaceae bacterium]
MAHTTDRYEKSEGFEARSSVRSSDPAFFEQLLDSIQDPVYVICPGEGFKIRFVNQAACRHWGYSQAHLLSMRIPDWDPHFSFEKCEAIWGRVQREKRITFETWHEVSSGALIPVEITSNYIVYQGEELIAGFIKDITERRETEEKISQLTMNLMRSNKQLEEFAYVASHDLREPLATLSSFVHLLETRHAPGWTGEAKRWLGYIQKSARRMANMIDSLLAYSRLNALELVTEPINTRALVGELLEDLRSMVESAQVEIRLGDLPRVVADRMQLGHVFQNLISNAVKFSQSAKEPFVEVSSQKADREWVFSVKDNGPGVDAETCDRIFEPFQKGHQQAGLAGVGLGLSICKKAVERHGGRLWLEPRRGGVTEFCFSLPIRETLS